MQRKRAIVGVLALVVLGVAILVTGGATASRSTVNRSADTKTPIKHLVVIFQENISFDHYFGTYPRAANTDGQPFVAAPHTPPVNGLSSTNGTSLPSSMQNGDLIAANPNLSRPARMDESPTGLAWNQYGQLTCDQDHNYSDEQKSFNNGAMNQFVQAVGQGNGTTPYGAPCNPNAVMDYYDGNTVTGMWNYAQHYAMNDNSYNTNFGPSAPGAINVVSGDTGNVDLVHQVNSPTIATSTAPNADISADGKGGYSLTSDAQPYWDDCSTRDAVALTGTNIGDELNGANISWGWFQGGFKPTQGFLQNAAGQPTSLFIPDEFANSGFAALTPHASNQALCDAVHPVGVAFGGNGQYGYKDDYIAHHEPFQYYATTANPHHLGLTTTSSGSDALTGPNSLSTVGMDTQSFSGGYGSGPQFNTPNHQYDSSDFDQLVAAINAGQLPASALPAVTYLKAPGYQDGHPAYSEPADEQAWLVKEINALMTTPDWASTAVVITYDDSDGWYDHAYPGIQNPSISPGDNLTNTVTGTISATNPVSGQCGPNPQSPSPLAFQQGRCGFGPRSPLVVISPCAKQNYVDHDLTDQASVVNFIEYNWGISPISGSFDSALSSVDSTENVPFDMAGMFDFTKCTTPAVQLDSATGRVTYENANLSGKNLAGWNFGAAEMSGVNLSNAKLSGAFMVSADLEGANLTGAKLNGARLSYADLKGAKLTGASTNGVKWTGATCPDGTTATADRGSCAGHL